MTVGVERARPGQEGHSISHQLPQSCRDPQWPHRAKGRDSHQLLPPAPVTALPQLHGDQHCSRDMGRCSTQLSCSLEKGRGEDKAQI